MYFETTVTFNSSPNDVFNAISKKLGSWWGKQDKLINEVDEIFIVSWGEPWYQFKVISYVENREMTWECVDANQIIDGLKGVQKEWVGTKVHWKLNEAENGKTILNFAHEGLIPDFICFQFCSKSWDHFLKEGLVKFLEQ